MMGDLNTQQGLVYEGNIHALLYVAGVLQKKAIGPIEITGFTTKAANEIKERKSLLVGQAGKTRGTMSRISPTELKIKANAANSDLYALFLLGSTAALNITGGTVTGESVASMEHDKWYQLDHKNVSSVTIATKTEGTDFEVDTKLGLIRTLSTGTIADNATNSVDYTYSGITGTTIKVGTEAKVDVKLIGRLVNSETGAEAILEVPKVTLSPDTELALIGDDYSEFSLTGKCVLLDGETADFYLHDPATYA
ncbi:MAG: phage tail tube protein [Gammaproteobacteria bacterium]